MKPLKFVVVGLSCAVAVSSAVPAGAAPSPGGPDDHEPWPALPSPITTGPSSGSEVMPPPVGAEGRPPRATDAPSPNAAADWPPTARPAPPGATGAPASSGLVSDAERSRVLAMVGASLTPALSIMSLRDVVTHVADAAGPSRPALQGAARTALTRGGRTSSDASLVRFVRDEAPAAWGRDMGLRQDQQPTPEALKAKKRDILQICAKVVRPDDPVLVRPTADFLVAFIGWCEADNGRLRHVRLVEAAQKAKDSGEESTMVEFIVRGADVAHQADRDAAEAEEIARARAEVTSLVGVWERGLLNPRLIKAGRIALQKGGVDLLSFARTWRTDHALQSQSLRNAGPGYRAQFLAARGADVRMNAGVFETPGVDEVAGATWEMPAATEPGSTGRHCTTVGRGTESAAVLRVDVTTRSVAAHTFSGDVSTWCTRPGHAGRGVSFESKAMPGWFLRQSKGGLYVGKAGEPQAGAPDAATRFAQESTWLVEDPQPVALSPASGRLLNEDDIRKEIGEPNGPEEAVDGGGVVAGAERGRVYWSKDSGAWWMAGVLADRFDAIGGPARFFPAADTRVLDAGGSREIQLEPRAALVWSSKPGGVFRVGAGHGGLWATNDAIRAAVGAFTSDQECEHDVCEAKTERGFMDAAGRWAYAWVGSVESDKMRKRLAAIKDIVGTPEPGAFSIERARAGGQVVTALMKKTSTGRFYIGGDNNGYFVPYGPLFAKWMQVSGPHRGLPASHAVQTSNASGVAGQNLAVHAATTEWIVSSPRGTFLVAGAIAQKYQELSLAKGRLGYPTSEEQSTGDTRFTDFERGRITADVKTGTVTVTSR